MSVSSANRLPTFLTASRLTGFLIRRKTESFPQYLVAILRGAAWRVGVTLRSLARCEPAQFWLIPSSSRLTTIFLGLDLRLRASRQAGNKRGRTFIVLSDRDSWRIGWNPHFLSLFESIPGVTVIHRGVARPQSLRAREIGTALRLSPISRQTSVSSRRLMTSPPSVSLSPEQIATMRRLLATRGIEPKRDIVTVGLRTGIYHRLMDREQTDRLDPRTVDQMTYLPIIEKLALQGSQVVVIGAEEPALPITSHERLIFDLRGPEHAEVQIAAGLAATFHICGATGTWTLGRTLNRPTIYTDAYGLVETSLLHFDLILPRVTVEKATGRRLSLRECLTREREIRRDITSNKAVFHLVQSSTNDILTALSEFLDLAPWTCTSIDTLSPRQVAAAQLLEEFSPSEGPPVRIADVYLRHDPEFGSSAGP